MFGPNVVVTALFLCMAMFLLSCLLHGMPSGGGVKFAQGTLFWVGIFGALGMTALFFFEGGDGVNKGNAQWLQDHLLIIVGLTVVTVLVGFVLMAIFGSIRKQIDARNNRNEELERGKAIRDRNLQKGSAGLDDPPEPVVNLPVRPRRAS